MNLKEAQLKVRDIGEYLKTHDTSDGLYEAKWLVAFADDLIEKKIMTDNVLNTVAGCPVCEKCRGIAQQALAVQKI